MPCLTARVLSRRRSSAAIYGVHVGEDGGDGGLFFQFREQDLKVPHHAQSARGM